MNVYRLGIALAIALSGCSSALPTPRPLPHGAALTVIPSVQAGGYHGQAVVPEVDSESVHHLVLKLNHLTQEGETPVLGAGGAPVEAVLSRSELGAPLTFTHLAARQTYRIRAFAYRAAEATPENLISVSDAGSFRDVEVRDDDRPTMAPLTVTLIATPFAATSSVKVSTTGSVLFDSVELGLYGLSNELEVLVATQSLRANELPATVAFENLQARTTYRVRGRAKNFFGTVLTGAEGMIDLAVDNETSAPTGHLQINVP